MRTLATVLAVLLAVPASAIQVEKFRSARPAALGGGTAESEVVSGEALVRFDAAMSRAEREAALASRGAGYEGEIAPTGWTHVTLPAGISVGAGLTILGSITGVREVAPNNAYRPTRIPNDPLFSQQYHLGKVNAQAAWEYGVGDSTTVTVAVLDAGIDGTHPDLTPKFSTTSWFCNPGACKQTSQCADPSADSLTCVPESPSLAACNHATRVAGVAAAASNNGSGVAGVSWGAKLISIRAFRQGDCTTSCDSVGSGCATDDAAIAKGIILANSLNNTPAHGRIVLNISLGSTTGCAGVLQSAINAAVATSTGMVITVSAGNEGGSVDSPANCVGVIPVGATDANDNIASFSNRGTELANNGVVAPGVGLTTTDLGGGTAPGNATGTSFSAPLVAGVAALIVAAKPGFSPTNVKDTLRASTDGIGVAAAGAPAGGPGAAVPAGNTSGAGRVNAFKAVKLAVDGTLAGFAGDQKVIAFPNPFRTSETGAVTITIPVALQSRGTSIRIYTIDGQLVRDLKTQTTWDGKNDGGYHVASGTYLVLVKTDAGTQTGKVAVIR